MRINRIFLSVDGEVPYQGQPSVFIRFQGCNMNPPCEYCDTPYAQATVLGMGMSEKAVLAKVKDIGGRCAKVTITGGEPLLQRDEFFKLTTALWNEGYKVSVETNGSLPIEGYGIACWIVDYKIRMGDKMLMDNYTKKINPRDVVKFVVSDHEEFRMAILARTDLISRGCEARFAFSPTFGELEPKELFEWMVEAEVTRNDLLNVQLHKYAGLE